MLPIRRLILLLLLAVGLAASPLRAQPAATPAATPAPAKPAGLAPAQAQQVLDMLRDDKRRAEFTATLEAVAAATPAAPAPAIALPLAPDSLGVQVVTQASQAVTAAGAQVLASVQAVNDLPLLWRWVVSQASNPDARAQMADAAWKLVVVLACALLAELGLRRLLRRLRTTLSGWAPHSPDAATPETPRGETGLAAAEAGETELADRRHRLGRALGALRRLPYLLGRLLLDLVPIAAFALVGDMLLGTRLGNPEKTRLVVQQAIESYAFCRVALAVAALLVSPATPRLRLLHVSDWAAAFLTRWIRRIVIIGVFGTALVDIGLLFGMYRTAHDAVLKVFALVIHLCLIVAVLQAREPVAARLHARRQAHGIWASLLNRFAEIWHLVAIFYIVALWLVWAVELRNGYVRLIHFCVVTFGVLIVARLLGVVLLGGLDRLRATVIQSSAMSGSPAGPGSITRCCARR